MYGLQSVWTLINFVNNKKSAKKKQTNKDKNKRRLCTVMADAAGISARDSMSVLSKGSDSDKDDRGDNFIKCIFFCKFHATAGPQIVTQVPNNYISKDVFDTISQYVIPKAQLQRCFVSVSLLGKKFLGYPVRIDNKLYARNAFYFNFCFVFAPTTRTVVFEEIIRKISEYMLSLELTSKILSQCSEDTAQLTRLIKLLTQIRTDLNRRKMCMLQEGSTIIPLCIVPHYKEPPVVKPYVAAVLKSEFYNYVESQWDLTTLRILPYINGFNHIARIASLADVALGLALQCIRHLILLGVATVIPVFQYCNIYRPTPKLSQLATCKQLQQRCIEQCTKINSQTNMPGTKANVRDVFRIFASMAHGATFGELCVRFNPSALHINERKMVLFGLLEGLIRRVDKYPITVQRNVFYDYEPIRSPIPSVTGTQSNNNYYNNHNSGSQPLPRNQRDKLMNRTNGVQMNDNHDTTSNNRFTFNSHERTTLQSNNQCQHYYNGLKSYDEICTKRGISCQQLDVQLSKDHHVIVILR
ncbi:GATOR complex protein NPRL2-like [Sitodiplosis mosellana]|uniref:GATOR complex protein NPRL2-like n=1 Tax=Sitodiplosis mosellana TaxID=263140 RepID=UPI002444272E|nr:GATOR complex protein NPRL2-like [Sitodiplosis mosellana]